MATYLFLSDDWLAEARAIRAEYEGQGGAIEHSIRMNLVVVEVPFGEGAVHAHVDTSTGVAVDVKALAQAGRTHNALVVDRLSGVRITRGG